MNYSIDTTPDFARELKQLAKRYPSMKDDYRDFLDALRKSPLQGEPLGKHLRKVRFPIASKAKGKSGGARVITHTVLTEINEKTLEAPAELLENPEVSEALKMLEVTAYTPAEMRAYDKFWDGISSDKTIIADYEYKLEQAKAEAEEAKAMLKQKDIDAARKMKSKGYAVEDIAEITGLTAEEIEAL